MAKPEAIAFLLDHRRDFFEVDGAMAAVGSNDGTGVPLLPKMARHPSVVELERCIESLRRVAPGHCAHLLGYHQAEYRIAKVPRRAGNGKVLKRFDEERRQWVVETTLERQRMVPRWVQPRMVKRGLDYLVFEFKGPVFIPDDLLALVA